MKRGLSNICFIFLIFIFFSKNLFPVVIGSDSAVSRQTQATFPAADSDNEMNGFAVFENGILTDRNECFFRVKPMEDEATDMLFYPALLIPFLESDHHDRRKRPLFWLGPSFFRKLDCTGPVDVRWLSLRVPLL